MKSVRGACDFSSKMQHFSVRACVSVCAYVCRVCTYVFPIVLVSVSLSKKNPRKSIKKMQAAASVLVHFRALWKVQNKMPNACNSWCIYIFLTSHYAQFEWVRKCVCVCVPACVCVCVECVLRSCGACACVLLFLTLYPIPFPLRPHTYTALRSRCSQHLRARYLLQIGLNSSAATAPTATATRLRSSCAPYVPPASDHSLLSLFLSLRVFFLFFLCHFVGVFVLFQFCCVRSPVIVYLHEYAHRNEITPPPSSASPAALCCPCHHRLITVGKQVSNQKERERQLQQNQRQIKVIKRH